MARPKKYSDLEQLLDDDLYDEAWGPAEPFRRLVRHAERADSTGDQLG